MKYKLILILILCCFPFSCYALSASTKNKYPFSVLTNDYGILNTIDLNSELDGVYPADRLPSRGHFYLYWQCFPREHVSFSLRDIGYSSYNLDENDSELTITAYNRKGTHQYGMRRNSAVSSNMKTFNQYQRLVRGQKYVCLEGMYFYSEDRVIEGKKERVHIWTFEKIKTRKGCESYFYDRCHYTNNT